MSKHTPGPWMLNDAFATPVVGVKISGKYPLLPIAHTVGGYDHKEAAANARLIAAAPELLKSQTMGESVNTPDFLDWIADRLVHVHKENESADFIISLRSRAKAGRAAIAKATGEQL